MRGWTLGVSIVVHLCVITGVIVAPLFATDDLPEPPRAWQVIVLGRRHEPPMTQPRRDTPPTAVADFPVVAPDTVVDEPVEPLRPADAIDVGIDTNDSTGNSFPPGNTTGIVVGNDLIPPIPEPAPVTPVRVGGVIRAPLRIHDVAPRYPAIAQASRVEGVVILEAVIEVDGSVRDVRVLRSKPLLDEAAIEAVRQWRFTPTMLNGQPVPVVMTVTVSFTLN